MKTCFVACAIGDRNSLERWYADLVLEKLIRPALKPLGFACRRIDQISGAGEDITQGILDAMLAADLVVADLTGLNPNVMYELGISQAWKLRVVPIACQGQRLPFDLAVTNTVFYELPTTRQRQQEGQARLRKRVQKTLENETENAIFAGAFSRVVGDDYAMDAVYRAVVEAMTNFCKSLDDRRHETRKEFDPTAKDAAEAMGQLILPVTRSLGDKVHVFRLIARGPSGIDDLDPFLLSQLEAVEKIERMADKLGRMLKGQGGRSRFKAADNIMAQMQGVAREVARRISQRQKRT